ncbi:rRNA maturation RNase YbeY [Thalassotalea sp. PS06]|uniref:rRNA maturation RNase YbeY n=1 Tax=Thalassotalea sp. PS06 TaxID=2594005 RepID=UPI001165691B|nr:rRNA maturation RNase YbeY [Thalassotalea sp. PS06]QDP01897.1 rRNA maturation RNase YbeY [Thalassotalea sp. PS06]
MTTSINTLDIQIACSDESGLPSAENMQLWVDTALSIYSKDAELTIRIVDSDESQQLNHQYRDKNKPTNVLSFPFEAPDGVELSLLGDLVICADVVKAEASEQNKPLTAHWAHMIIHGCLHLLGYDHIREVDAEEMEALEVKLLASLNINNPYITD